MAAEALLDRPPFTRPAAPSRAAAVRLRDLLGRLREARGRNAQPGAIDVCQTAGEYVVRVAVPASAEGVEFRVGRRLVRVPAEGAHPTRYLRLRERPYGWFLRTVAVPPAMTAAELRFRLREGTLEIRAPA